jgi:hypothetical protein
MGRVDRKLGMKRINWMERMYSVKRMNRVERMKSVKVKTGWTGCEVSTR